MSNYLIPDESTLIFFDQKKGRSWSTIEENLFSNIGDLWKILDSFVEDWMKLILPFDEKINMKKDSNEKYIEATNALNLVRSNFLKYFFSYTLFARILEKAYLLLFKQLERIASNAGMSCPAQPEKDSVVENARRIRNKAICHPGEISDVKKLFDSIDNIAGLDWTITFYQSIPMQWSIDHIRFMDFTLVLTISEENKRATSQIKGVSFKELRDHYRQFLLKYDEICSAFLKDLKNTLPRSSIHPDQYEWKGP